MNKIIENKDLELESKLHIEGYYRHFKGNVYKVLGLAYDQDLNKVVVYQAQYEFLGKKNVLFTRGLEEFMSRVPEGRTESVNKEYRFEYLGDSYEH